MKPVSFSMESIENREALPFWMRASTALEFLRDRCRSVPT